MSEQPRHKDLICAFLDEELSESDLDELLSQLECQDTRARACRQSLVASLLAGRHTLCTDVSGRVREAIAQELAAPAGAPLATPATVVPLSGHRARRGVRGGYDWKVPAGGLALAASMALVAVFIVKPSQPVQDAAPAAQVADATADTPATLVSNAAAPAGTTAAPRELVIAAPEHSRPLVAQWGSAEAGTRPVSSPAAVQQQLNTFLINHARNGGANALSGSLGYARVAASPQQQSEEPHR